MDPLSITASTIALIEFCRKLSHGLKILKDLSHVAEEISALLDELQDLRNVLAAVCVVIEQRLNVEGLDACTEELKSLLVKAGRIFASIATHCGITIHQDLNSDRGKGTDSFSAPVLLDPLTRFRWLKDRKKIDSYRQRLKIIRLDIANHLASLNLVGSCSVLVELRDLAGTLRKLSVDQSLLQESLQTIMPKPTPVDDTREKGRNSSLTDFDDELSLNKSPTSPVDGPPAYDAFDELSSCSCSCHRVSTITTPGILQDLCGTLTVKFHGISGMTPPCDEIVCIKSKHSSFKLNYRFPPWLLNYAIDTLLTTSHARGPQMSLSPTRIIPNYSEVFSFAMQGDIAAIKGLFRKGLASPFDATSNYGYTALHYAIDYDHFELCDFLLKSGARTDIPDFNNRSATDIAYFKLCTSDLGIRHKERIQLMFGEESWLEQRQFSVLHKIVLKLAKTRLSLAEQLRISTKEINAVDSEGRTPLSWAAELGSEDAVSALLNFGADSNKIDKDSNTPLHYACKSPSFEVMRLLLDAGSDVTHRNKWGQTPFNWASFFQHDIRFFKELCLRPGVCLNEVDNQGISAIENACFQSHEKVVSYLLEQGADPNIAEEGSTPLMDGIILNRHGSFSVLLEKSSSSALDFAYQDSSGETCLHALARMADLKTASIFLQALENGIIDISGFDTAHVGKEGLTARDLLRLRGNEDVQEVLERALVIIDQGNASEKSSESSDDDPYVDAFELLPQLEKDVGLKRLTVRVVEI